jgi:hypothetical protein
MTSSIGTFQELREQIRLYTPIAADFLTPNLVKELFLEMRRGIAPVSPRIQNKIWNQLLLNTGLSERSLYKVENVKRLLLGYHDEDYR